jgi:hypothetical protein
MKYKDDAKLSISLLMNTIWRHSDSKWFVLSYSAHRIVSLECTCNDAGRCFLKYIDHILRQVGCSRLICVDEVLHERSSGMPIDTSIDIQNCTLVART